ncbi:hypothetical protein SDC9_179725 [bioreactor metagenome]|uniref:Uncharacterized protein n=1 Tax=bioreactor metagenome TaxID=1076179 RepID=A0A645H2N9_9ZZZZ
MNFNKLAFGAHATADIVEVQLLCFRVLADDCAARGTKAQLVHRNIRAVDRAGNRTDLGIRAVHAGEVYARGHDVDVHFLKRAGQRGGNLNHQGLRGHVCVQIEPVEDVVQIVAEVNLQRAVRRNAVTHLLAIGEIAIGRFGERNVAARSNAEFHAARYPVDLDLLDRRRRDGRLFRNDDLVRVLVDTARGVDHAVDEVVHPAALPTKVGKDVVSGE